MAWTFLALRGARQLAWLPRFLCREVDRQMKDQLLRPPSPSARVSDDAPRSTMGSSSVERPRNDDNDRPRAGVNTRVPTVRDPAPRPSVEAPSTVLASALGFAAAASIAGVIAWASGCHGDSPPGASSDKPTRTNHLPAPPAPSAAPRASARVAAAAPVEARDAGTDADASAEIAEAEKPYTGPLLGALAVQTPVFPTMEMGKKRLGYIRLGGKVPVDPNPTKNASCQAGWYRLLDGGYVCGKYATTDHREPAGPPRHHGAEPRGGPAVQVRVQHRARHAALPIGPLEGGHDPVRALPRDVQEGAPQGEEGRREGRGRGGEGAFEGSSCRA